MGPRVPRPSAGQSSHVPRRTHVQSTYVMSTEIVGELILAGWLIVMIMGVMGLE